MYHLIKALVQRHNSLYTTEAIVKRKRYFRDVMVLLSVFKKRRWFSKNLLLPAFFLLFFTKKLRRVAHKKLHNNSFSSQIITLLPLFSRKYIQHTWSVFFFKFTQAVALFPAYLLGELHLNQLNNSL